MKKFIGLAALILGLVLVGTAGYQLLAAKRDYAAAESVYVDMVQDYLVPTTAAPDDSKKPNLELPGQAVCIEATQETAPSFGVSFAELWTVSEDVVGWIYCPNTSINYPVVQTENNTDYLHRLLDGSYNRSGTIFMDCRCDTQLAQLTTILYGQSTQSDAMFGPLENYQEQSYYETHPMMFYLTPEGNYRIDLIAGLTVPADSEQYLIDPDEEAFQDFLAEILAESTFRTTYNTSNVERVMMLSTCSDSLPSDRYIVVGAVTPLE